MAQLNNWTFAAPADNHSAAAPRARSASSVSRAWRTSFEGCRSSSKTRHIDKLEQAALCSRDSTICISRLPACSFNPLHDGVQFGTRWLKICTVGIRRDSEIRYEGLEILGGELKPDFEKCRGANQNRNDFKVWINAANCP